MQTKEMSKKGVMGVMLSILLVFLSAFAPVSGYSQPLHSASVSHLTQAKEADASGNSVSDAQSAPVKSLAPSLSSIVRAGSYMPEHSNGAEPEFELVTELNTHSARNPFLQVHDLFSHWHDWTLRPPSTAHRLSGWKDSNLLYRFISQSRA
ncbi:hypothetical protein LRP49_19255 [Enterovibrio sp. ZSDZ35]|uniref:Uncharacterized protein n=1 Tax=Enterovibrio qingdaonensis TaxID=2899818 RepID=A0ABT5QQP4_9GAMM|nr:hypothetical protein [Enterovibrio sp. ZSDZ35]MDD1783311.1 hypothetical protein [Enterovibrio sp. ZSDZ35]